jgi:hypothetical protein
MSEEKRRHAIDHLTHCIRGRERSRRVLEAAIEQTRWAHEDHEQWKNKTFAAHTALCDDVIGDLDLE